MNHSGGSDQPETNRRGYLPRQFKSLVTQLHRAADQRRPRPDDQTSQEAQLVRVTRWLVVATIALAVAGFLGFGAALLQWRTLVSADEKTGQTIGVLVDQAHTMRGQLDEMKKAYDLTTRAVAVAETTANAAIEANNLTRQTFVAGQRPWVVYDYLATKITSPLFLDTQSGGRMELEFSVRNTGQTIARNTAIYAAISFLGAKHFDRVAEQKSYCATMRLFTPPVNAMTIVPDKTFSPFPTTIALVNREALNDTLEGSEKKKVTPFIIGCIDYQSVFETSHHQTPFIFDLGTLSQPNSLVLQPIELAQSPISIDRLRIRKFTLGGENPD